MRIAAILSLPLLAAGCMPRSMQVPEQFVPVPEHRLGDFTQRAVSADGVIVGLQVRPNPPQGTLAFWSQATQNELAGRGYKLVKAEDVKSAAALPGKLLTFSAERSGVAHTYLVGVFVAGKDILLPQAGGKSDAVEPRLPAIRQAILSVR